MKNGIGKVLKVTPNTAIVEIERVYSHPKYHKRIRTTSKLMVHDDLGVNVGDVVNFVLCAPISKRKRHVIKEIV